MAIRKRLLKILTAPARWTKMLWRLIGKPDFSEVGFLLLFLAALILIISVGHWALSTQTISISRIPIPVLDPCKADTPTEKHCFGWDDIRSIMFALAGLVGAVFGLFQLKNSATRTRLSRIDTDVKREAERNDRYVKAVELLKDEDDSVRMGGIYALERLAVEDDGKYFTTVVEVLAAYIRYRTNAEDEKGEPAYPPRRKAGKKPVAEELPETATADEKHTRDAQYRERLDGWAQRGAPTEPVKAALLALKRLWESNHALEDSQEAVDLRNAWLIGAEAIGFSMRRWQFNGAHLEGAYLGNAHLEGAKLWSAHLEGAKLWSAHLEGAYLGEAHLEGAYLRDAHLEGAKLWGAHLEDAYLGSAHLEGAYLGGAHLEGADLMHANLEGAIMNGEQLNAAIWPTDSPPASFPDGYKAEDFDKSWCTDPADAAKLLPKEKWGTPPEWKEDEG